MLPQRPIQQWIQQGRDKIETWLDGHDHAGFQTASQAEKGRVVRRRRGLSSHVVNLDTQKMTDAMGEEHTGDAFFDNVLVIQAGYQTGRRQQSGKPLMGLTMNVDVIYARRDHVAEPDLEPIETVDQRREVRLVRSCRGAGNVGAVATKTDPGINQQTPGLPRRLRIVILVVQRAGVLVQSDDAVIRRIRFPLTGRLLVGQVDAKLALTGQEGLPGRRMTCQSQPVGLRKTLDFILGLAHAGLIQCPQ